jgi:hypothetical protein
VLSSLNRTVRGVSSLSALDNMVSDPVRWLGDLTHRVLLP